MPLSQLSRILRPKPRSSATILYWMQGEPRQNFGDFLTELLKEALTIPRMEAAAFRLVGSAISNSLLEKDLYQNHVSTDGKIVYWGCGMRDEAPIEPHLKERAVFCGVRGPLSRDALGLPPETVLGDPGFLVPLLYTPKPSATTSGKKICVPHFHDPKNDADLLRLSGADAVLRPVIKNSMADLHRILDDIAAADFVLTGALHGAVIAAAYNVPFAFWNTGYIDLPFKWRDLAASLSIPTLFSTNVHEGAEVFEKEIKPRLTPPHLLPLLQVAPFTVKQEILERAKQADTTRR